MISFVFDGGKVGRDKFKRKDLFESESGLSLGKVVEILVKVDLIIANSRGGVVLAS